MQACKQNRRWAVGSRCPPCLSRLLPPRSQRAQHSRVHPQCWVAPPGMPPAVSRRLWAADLGQGAARPRAPRGHPAAPAGQQACGGGACSSCCCWCCCFCCGGLRSTGLISNAAGALFCRAGEHTAYDGEGSKSNVGARLTQKQAVLCGVSGYNLISLAGAGHHHHRD